MGRGAIAWLLIAACLGGWFLWQHYEIRGLADLELVRRGGEAGGAGSLPAARRDHQTIRVASFHLPSFGPAKAENMAVMDVSARIIREFDIVALQGIGSPRPDLLRAFLDRVNETGRAYSLLAGPPVGRSPSKEQFIFVFDQAAVETDRGAAYTVDDPDDLLHRPPLVGWFRVRGPAPEQAFTFTLVNVHVDPEDTAFETRTLVDVFYRVRDDGRGEDDVILLGDFQADEQRLGDLTSVPGIMTAIHATPTTTRQTRQSDNLLFQLPATCEYVGRSGVFDFMRTYNLTLEQALEVSDHLPVWAEFSIWEGGINPASVAVQGAGTVR